MDKNTKRILTLAAGTGAAALVYYLLNSESSESKKEKPVSASTQNKAEPTPPPAVDHEESMKKLGIPKVGTGADLMPDYCGALRTFSQKIDELGTGIGYIDMYGFPTVIISKPEYCRKVLAHNTQHALWGGLETASKAFFGNKVLFVLEGDEWRGLRNTIKHALSTQNVAQMNSDVVNIANAFSKSMIAGKEVDMNLLCGSYHLSAIGKSAFNFDLNCLEVVKLGPNDISKSFEFFISELPRRSLAPDQTILGDYETDNEDNRKWKAAANTVRMTIEKVVQKRISDQNKGLKTRHDLLDAMIEAYDDELGRTASEEELDSLTDNLVEILFAGYNTNVGTIANVLYFLSQNPEFLREVQAEVDAAIPDSALENTDVASKISFDLSKFKTLQNCYYETLRMAPPAPLVARLTSKDMQLSDDMFLPKMMPCWFPCEYLHMNNDHWPCFDAAKFNPNRWKSKNPFTPGAYFPFSSGPRDCIGKNFALLEAVAGLAFLLKRFEFTPADGYEFKPLFNGFGYRPCDGSTMEIGMRLIPKARK